MTSSDKGLENIKTTFEEILQVIYEQVRQTEAAQKAMASDLDELNSEELTLFKEHRKVKTFMQGIQALLVTLTMLISTLDVAE